MMYIQVYRAASSLTEKPMRPTGWTFLLSAVLSGCATKNPLSSDDFAPDTGPSSPVDALGNDADADADGDGDGDGAGSDDTGTTDVDEADGDDTGTTDVDEGPGETDVDEDGDGATLEDGDCDDSDATIYPGASEILDDDIDQDCNGHDALTCTGDYTYADAEHCGVITGNLFIATDLMTIDGLNSLTHIGGNFHVVGNTALTSFSLDSLTHVDGQIMIHSNTALTSFSLAGLTAVGVELRIHFNNSLTSFSLDSLADIGAALLFWYNSSLCQSQVDEFIESLTAHGWTGSDLYIGYNADC
jgi:hypothetical protein